VGVMPLRSLVVVSHKYPPYATGGLAPYVERSLRALRAARPDTRMTLYTFDYPAGMPRRATQADGLVVRRPRMPRVLRRLLLNPDVDFRGVGRIVFAVVLALFNLQVVAAVVTRHRRRTDVVTVHDWQSTPAGVLLSLLFRWPVVYHVHNTEMTMATGGVDYGVSGLIGTFERLMAGLARKVIVPTPEVRDMLVALGWPGDRIDVVPHGFEAHRMDAYRRLPAGARRRAVCELRAELGIADDEKVVVFVGRLSRVKGVRTLVDAVPALLDRYPRLRVVVLGVGFPGTDESASIQRRVAELDVGDHVHIYDRYLDGESVARHYDMADVCVFPSTFEPFGLVSVEAMSFARPVVLGPGFSRVISHGPDGANALVMRTDSEAELVELVGDVLDRPAEAQRMADRARVHVFRELTWRRCIDATLRSYDEVADTETSASC
jgi:glycosyltransferase involved in cell wall biosynthesis